MTTQEIVVFDNKDKAGLHISFCDKDLHLTARIAEAQYDFIIRAEVLMGLHTIYQEQCKKVDSYDNRNEVQHRG